jgi:hypothetical protein
MSSPIHGDRVLVIGGTYKYHMAKFNRYTGAFSAKIVLESTGDEKTIQRRNLRVVTAPPHVTAPPQAPHQQRPSSPQRNTAVASGGAHNAIKIEDTNSAETAPSAASATAASATAPSRHQERWRGTGQHTGGETSEEDLASATLELSQVALDLSLLMARLGIVTDTLNRNMSDNR